MFRCVWDVRMGSFFSFVRSFFPDRSHDATQLNCSAALLPLPRFRRFGWKTAKLVVPVLPLLFFSILQSFSLAVGCDPALYAVFFFFSCRQNDNIISRHRLPSICIHTHSHSHSPPPPHFSVKRVENERIFCLCVTKNRKHKEWETCC